MMTEDQPTNAASLTAAKMMASGRYSDQEKRAISVDTCAIRGIPADQVDAVHETALTMESEIRKQTAAYEAEARKVIANTKASIG
jgi:hypothetical protein